MNIYDRYKEGGARSAAMGDGFFSRNIISLPDKWYKMSPGQIMGHNLGGAGFWNDALSAVSPLGVASYFAMDAADENISPIESFASLGASTIGGRIGIGVGAASGNVIGNFIGGGLSKSLAEKSIIGSATSKSFVSAFGRIAGTALGGGVGALAGTVLGGLAVDGFKKAVDAGYSIGLPELGYGYEDTQASATMRRRSLMAMKTSRFNSKSVIGNEALRLATGM